ncbi:hypothetical protein AA0472_0176 [Acetobacter estunensis NRIC 0472]|nr:hypothetical protein AA0472_0176 [Acetobacter estunensis NRIC 0472]
MFGMLKTGLGGHPITTACRIPPELKIFLEQLLGRAAHPHLWTIAVEDMITVQRYLPVLLA